MPQEKDDRGREIQRSKDGWTRVRPERMGLAMYGKLADIPEKPGYMRHVFNDTEGRIEFMKSRGWRPVEVKPEDAKKSSVQDGNPLTYTMTKNVGGGIRGVVMEIPIEWYNEDYQRKQELPDAIERSLNPKNQEVYKGYKPSDAPMTDGLTTNLGNLQLDGLVINRDRK